MQTTCWLVPRALAENAGPWDESLSLHDDGEYFCRALLASNGIRYCDEAKVYYRTGLEGSLSRRRSREAIESALAVCESYERHTLCREDSPCVRHALARNYARFIDEVHPQHPDLLDRARKRIRDLGFRRPPSCGGMRFRALAALVGFEQALAIRACLRRG